MGGRGLIRLQYVNAFTDRAGRRRHYFRRHGVRTVLPGLPGSAEFMAAYAEALAATGAQAPAARRPDAPAGSLAALAQRYYTSPKFLALSPSSRRHYRRVIDGFLAKHGHRLARQLTREKVDVLVGAMANTPGAGIVFLKRLRGLMRYGMAIRWIDRDPTAGATSYKSREIHTWTEEEIAAFEAHWPSGSRERLAFALLLYTGQRGSDVHRMTWADIVGDRIRVAQQKTAEKLVIVLHPALRTELGLARRTHAMILATAYGRAFSVKGFGQMVSSCIAAAGLPARCKAHGLRKAAARRLAEVGATSKEIAAVTGHRTLAEIERYTRAADQEKLARTAIEKQVGAQPKLREA